MWYYEWDDEGSLIRSISEKNDTMDNKAYLKYPVKKYIPNIDNLLNEHTLVIKRESNYQFSMRLEFHPCHLLTWKRREVYNIENDIDYANAILEDIRVKFTAIQVKNTKWIYNQHYFNEYFSRFE